jgi:MtrB/PioB family decaheme-associated outer membrane protein
MNAQVRKAIPLTAIAAALLSIFGPAGAAETAQPEAIRPTSSIGVGAGYLTNDAPRFGQYTGLRKEGVYGLFDADIVTRDDATGTWMNFSGRGLGLDSRALRFEHNRQGNWGYFLEYDQIPRFDPYTVNTRLLGIGTAVQTVNGLATPQAVQLKTERQRITLGFGKLLGAGFDFKVRVINEEKDGSRLYGQGTSPGTGNTRFLADPINYTTRQLEALFGYTGDQLQLSGGYYGTDFINHQPVLTVIGGVHSPMALPPGNQAHQLHLTGGYNLTRTTRAMFKAAYTHQTQEENFVTPAMASVGRTNLGGRVNTTMLQLGVTARPLPRLSLLANARYEDRDDRTPIRQYQVPGTTLDGINEPRSITTATGKIEASYALPMGFRLTGGVEEERKKRNTFRTRSVSHRDETEELSWRAELRRSMSETLTGALAYVHSKRDGSPFLTTFTSAGALGSNLIHPIHLADRDREKIRLTLDWQPINPLSVQFFIDYAEDKYSGRELGPREGDAQTYSVDVGYAFSPQWQATAWFTHNNTRAKQATRSGTTQWAADLENVGDALGLGTRGKPFGWLEVGADIYHSRDRSAFGLARETGAAAVAPLPSINFDVTGLKLFAKYAVKKNTSLQLNYFYERWGTDDWTWMTYVYGAPNTLDGTTVSQIPVQKVHFIGLSVQHRWQ